MLTDVYASCHPRVRGHRQTSMSRRESPMARVQLALNVDDLDAAVGFYSALFRAEPAKRRPGYANFAIASPPLKLVLLESPGRGGTLNHLGVEVESTEQVDDEVARLREAGLVPAEEKNAACCYAVQDKAWVTAPSGEPWEIYTVLADSPGAVGEHRVDLPRLPARRGHPGLVLHGVATGGVLLLGRDQAGLAQPGDLVVDLLGRLDLDSKVVERAAAAGALQQDELERRRSDREVGIAGAALGRLGPEQRRVEPDRRVEVVDVQRELDPCHGTLPP